MAVRPVFTVSLDERLCVKRDVEFTFYSGCSDAQKKRCVRSLHQAYLEEAPDARVLEVSSRSEEELGVRLSAFNLMMTWGNGARISVESAFQGSKVFEQGGPYRDLWSKSSRDAKRDPRLRSSGGVVGFQFGNKVFSCEPKTFFYDWLYIHTLAQEGNAALAEGILAYDAFTDIEFNPKRSINCQAEAAAIFVSLSRQGLLRGALESEDSFREIVFQEAVRGTPVEPAGEQGHLF